MPDDLDLTEFDMIDPSRVDAVGTPANGIGFLVLKSADPEEAIKEFVDGLCGISGCDVCHERYQALKETDGFVEKARLKAKARHALSDSDFAFPKERKEPLNDAGHVRAAMGRFNQVEGVSSEERKTAAHKIISRAKSLGIDVSEDSDVAQAAKDTAPDKSVPEGEAESQTRDNVEGNEQGSHDPSAGVAEAQGASGEPRHVDFPHPPAGDGGGDTAPDKDMHESEAESQTHDNVEGNAEKAAPGSPEWEHKDVELGQRAEALTNELNDVVHTFTEREKAEGGGASKEAAAVISRVKRLLENPALVKELARTMSATDVLKELLGDESRRTEDETAAKAAEKKAFDKAVKKEAKKQAKKLLKAQMDDDDKTEEGADDASKSAEVADPSKMSHEDLIKEVARLSDDLAKVSAEDGKRIPLNAAGTVAFLRSNPEAAESVFKSFEDRVAEAQEDLQKAVAASGGASTGAVRRARDEVRKAGKALAGVKFITAERARENDPVALTRSMRGQGNQILKVRDELGDDPGVKGW